MSPLELSICFWNYDRVTPLVDGRVKIDGCKPSFHGRFAHVYLNNL